MRRSLLVLVSALAFSVAGCGDGEEGEDEEAARAPCGAAPTALAGEPQLPAGFPRPAEVTYTRDEASGPSQVTEGYWDGELGEAYDGYKSAFDSSSFEVTKEEREEDDAEVNFESDSSSGQVKLLQECAERTSVRITVRPK